MCALIASATRTMRYVKSVGTFISHLQVSSGDLFQIYNGQAVSPEFSATDPAVLRFVNFDTSKGANVTYDPAKDGQDYEFHWYLGSISTQTEISFDAAGLSTGVKDPVMAGVFLKEPGGVLKIVGNLAVALGHVSSYLICQCIQANTNGGTKTFVAQCPITIIKAVDNTWVASIYGDPSLTTTSGVQGEAGYTIQLKCQVFEGLTAVTSGLTFVWQKWDHSVGGWKHLGSGPAWQMTADDINSAEFIRVSVMKDGKVVAEDTETVYDDSDPFVINANPTPADETIYQDTTLNGSVTYAPIVVSRSNPTADLKPGQVFDFDVFDATGVNIAGANAKGVASYTVGRDLCELANSNLEVYITAKV